MEIINTYDETISHYSMKLNHAEDELNLALKGLQELESAEMRWRPKGTWSRSVRLCLSSAG